MRPKLIGSILVGLMAVAFVAADEYEGVIDSTSRRVTATRQKTDPNVISIGQITRDSKGQVVKTNYFSKSLTKDAKVVMGTFDEDLKKWVPGEPVKGGIKAGIFNGDKVLEVIVTLADDRKSITQILVKNTDAKIVKASASDFDAIVKQVGSKVGPQTVGVTPVFYARLDVDEKGKVLKAFQTSSSAVTQDTKVVMGKYDATGKKWTAGEAIPKGVFGDIFRDPGAKNIYVRITMRADRKAIAQILVQQVGDQGKK